MGEVYRARDTRLGRTVAIKVLKPGLTSDPAARQRLEREARAISSLVASSHLPAVRHRSPGRDRLPGDGSTSKETRSRRVWRVANVAPGDALRYGMQITDALAAAHRAGIVHRDLKPGNVILTNDGAMLLDFGLARAREESIAIDGDAATLSEPLTTEGAILGTLRYMAPEQLAGRPADFRTDVFALGLVFAELYGHSPGDKRPPADAATRAAGLTAHVPRDIRWIVDRCLQDDPDARWQHAGDVFIALEAVTRGDASAPARSHPLANRYVLDSARDHCGCCGSDGGMDDRASPTRRGTVPRRIRVAHGGRSGLASGRVARRSRGRVHPLA